MSKSPESIALDDEIAVPTATPLDERAAEAKKPADPVVEEQKLRRNLSRYLIVIVACLCFYTFVLDHLQQLSAAFSSASYITTGILIIFMAALGFLIFSSGYPLREFGLTLHNWRRSLREGILFTIPILIAMLLLKWMVIKFIPAYHGIPLFDLHGGVMQVALEGTASGNAIWWETLLLYSLVIAPLQEVITRGGLQGALTIFLTGKYRTLAAILITNLMFSTTHLAGPVHIVLLSFFGGLFWGWLFYRHKTVIGAIASHILIGLWFFWFLGIA